MAVFNALSFASVENYKPDFCKKLLGKILNY